ncbi:MAG: hypothetical protein ACFFAN_10410 [Promethearchaeota archaeon]
MVKCYLCKEEANTNCSYCKRPICSVHGTTIKSHVRCVNCAKFRKGSIIANISIITWLIIFICCCVVPIFIAIILIVFGINLTS